MKGAQTILSGLKIASFTLFFWTALPLGAQNPPSTPTQSPATAAQNGPAWSPSKDIGVFVFGRAGQSADQQLKDESECYAAAKQQSGIDPKAPPPPTKTEEQKKAEQQAAAKDAEQVKGGRAEGAARGAAGGAAIGAIAGDAGKGAGAGAVAGTMRGGMAQRQANATGQKQAAANVAEQQEKEEEQAKLAHAEGQDTFQRAFGACMDARNYSVK